MILADAAHVHATQVTVLPNGLTVLVHEDRRFPLVAIRLFVRAGSAHELPEQAGISHMLEHMVFKGTSARAPGEVAAQIEGIGGELNAATGFDSTMYIMDVPDSHWVLALEVLQDMIFQAAIDPGELESERQVVLSELDQGQDQPHRRLFQAIQKMIWAGTPYERPIIGLPETIQNISREDILAYIQRRYQPGNMLLVVCGNVHQEEVLAQAQRLFGNLSNQGVARIFSLPALPLVDQAPQLSIERGPWRKAQFALALPIPGLGSIQGVGLDVLAQMLGGDRTSLLYRTFKHEQGIVDAISASATSLEQAGMLYIQAQLDPENIPRLWEGLIALLANLSVDSFAPEALERAKLNLENNLFQAKETLGGLASKLGYFQFHENSVTAEQRYLYQVRHMDRAQLAALIAEYVRSEGLTAAVFTPQPDELDTEEMLARLSENWPWTEEGQKQLNGAKVLGAPDFSQREILSIAPGRTLVLLPDASLPYTALHLAWTGGDMLLAPEEQGLAELTARVWTKGSKSMDAVGIQDFLADRAAQVSAGAGLEQFFMSAYYPSRFSKDMLPFFLELVREPAWAPEELDRAKKDQTAAIVRSEDHPVGLAFRRIFPFLFPGHPYGYQRAGEPETMGAFTREQVAAFRERQIGKPWVLAVSGDFDREEIIALAQSIVEIEVQVPTQSSPPLWGGDRKKILNLADRNQAHVFAMFPIPGLAHEDSAGLKVLREILAGQSGLLFQDLRDDQGLAYTVSAFLRQDSLAGFLALYIATAPELVDEALAGFKAALARLSKAPVSEAELARAVNLLRGDYHRGRQPLMARAHEVSEALVRGLDPDHELRMLEQAEKLTPESLSTLAEAYLHWDKAYFMKVLP
jgi:zinc protease